MEIAHCTSAWQHRTGSQMSPDIRRASPWSHLLIVSFSLYCKDVQTIIKIQRQKTLYLSRNEGVSKNLRQNRIIIITVIQNRCKCVSAFGLFRSCNAAEWEVGWGELRAIVVGQISMIICMSKGTAGIDCDTGTGMKRWSWKCWIWVMKGMGLRGWTLVKAWDRWDLKKGAWIVIMKALGKETMCQLGPEANMTLKWCRIVIERCWICRMSSRKSGKMIKSQTYSKSGMLTSMVCESFSKTKKSLLCPPILID